MAIGAGRMRCRISMHAAPGRVSQLLVCGVDLGHGPVCSPLDGWIAARDVRMMLPGKVPPGALDCVGRRVERQSQDNERVPWHPASLTGRRR
jgi:hypothetical protein